MDNLKESMTEIQRHPDGEEYFYEREELLKFADDHGIKNLDLDIINDLGNVRRPLVLLRGKSITVEQTKQLITGEEPLFGDGADCKCWFDPRMDRGVLKNVFYRPGFDWLSTWVYSDGTIGGNLIFLGKYPDWDEMILPYMHLAKRYPFLILLYPIRCMTRTVVICAVFLTAKMMS